MQFFLHFGWVWGPVCGPLRCMLCLWVRRTLLMVVEVKFWRVWSFRLRHEHFGPKVQFSVGIWLHVQSSLQPCARQQNPPLHPGAKPSTTPSLNKPPFERQLVVRPSTTTPIYPEGPFKKPQVATIPSTILNGPLSPRRPCTHRQNPPPEYISHTFLPEWYKFHKDYHPEKLACADKLALEQRDTRQFGFQD